MNPGIAPLICLSLTLVVAATAAEPAFFEGKAEAERVRVLALIENCRDLDTLVKHIGPSDAVSVANFPAPRHPDEWCGTGGRILSVRTVRFASLSRQVDLDVIVAPNGALWTAVITEKSPRPRH